MKDVLNNYPYPIVKNGSAKGVEEFFEKLIKPQFGKKDTIKRLHEALLKYINMDGHTLFLRMYGSFKPENYGSLRRGFLTKFPKGNRMAFCDNTFAMLFAGFKLAGYELSEQKLKDLFTKKELVCSFGLTTMEKELAYYTPKNAIRLDFNSKGWYLAHLKPVGKDIDKKKPSDFFVNPERNEWCAKEKIRTAINNLDDTQENILKKHFIRLVHPLNSILVPKRNRLIYNGTNIGEESELIKFVTEYISNEFNDEYKEFDDFTGKCNIESGNGKIQDIKWFGSPQKQDDKKEKTEITKTKQPVKPKLKDENEKPLIPIDIINEDYMATKLDGWLNSIGKQAFVNIYPLVKEKPEIDKKEVFQFFPKYKASRVSSSKSIIRYGLEREALNIIIKSKIPDGFKERALGYLKELDV